MVDNRSRPPGIIPTLYYEDVGEAIDWLCNAFGFKERFRYGPEDAVQGAQLQAGDGVVMLGVARMGQSPEWDDEMEMRPPRKDEANVVIGVHVANIDQHERAREFGAMIISEPETHTFGERQYTAEDPAGYRWGFSESIADAAPEDWGGTTPTAAGGD